MRKRFWPIFFRIIECDKPHGTICKGPKVNLTFTVEGLHIATPKIIKVVHKIEIQRGDPQLRKQIKCSLASKKN